MFCGSAAQALNVAKTGIWLSAINNFLRWLNNKNQINLFTKDLNIPFYFIFLVFQSLK